MRDPALILVVDDNEANVDILATRLSTRGYAVITARDGAEAVLTATRELPDLILLDVMMPKLDGLEVTRRLRANASLPFMPIILCTAKSGTEDVIAGLEAGADEYLVKPIDQAALVARVRSILRTKRLHDTVQSQAQVLTAQAAELAEMNRSLEERVARQVREIERFGRLRRFLPRAVAELVVSSGEGSLLDTHRREIAVVFCDLRGFTAFAEVAEPEEVTGVLASYHQTVGPLIEQHEGTLERFLGDGLMVLFNDPIPCQDPAGRAVNLALEICTAVDRLSANWARSGHRLGCGVGIAFGFATLGRIGFDGREDYTAIGTIVNQAARLCGEAKPGEILVTQRVASALDAGFGREPLGELSLKGLRQPVTAYRIGRGHTAAR
jgi:class 3 adenylate cyclase/CheY-like chemotaxis protein